MQTQAWMIVPGNAALSALILFVIAMPFLYAARRPVHELLRALGHLARAAAALRARSLARGAEHALSATGQCCSRTGAQEAGSASSASSSASPRS